MSIDHIISEISNLRIGKVILIGDNITLLDYRHQFIESLHVVEVGHGPEHLVSRYNIHRVLDCS